MSIHRVSPFASKAATVFVLLGVDVVLSAATAESRAEASSPTTVSTKVREYQGAPQATRGAESCRVIDRPKHKVVRCDCPNDPIAGVSSVDAAAMLSLAFGRPTCRAPASARQSAPAERTAEKR